MTDRAAGDAVRHEGYTTRASGSVDVLATIAAAMDPRALALVLVAALFHAAWNLRLHRGGDRRAAMALGSLAGGVLLSPALLLRFPSGVLGLVALSAAAETAYGVALASAYARGDLSVVYPIGRGTSPLLVTVAAIAVLGQRPGAVAVAGAVTLGAGLVLVATRADAHRAAVAGAALVGVCIAAYSVIDARAVRDTDPVGYLSAVLLLTGAAQALLLRIDLRRLRAAAGTAAAVGAGTIGSYVLVLFALRLAPAGRVSTLREIAVPIAMLAARDRAGVRGWAGAALVVAGAVLAGS